MDHFKPVTNYKSVYTVNRFHSRTRKHTPQLTYAFQNWLESGFRNPWSIYMPVSVIDVLRNLIHNWFNVFRVNIPIDNIYLLYHKLPGGNLIKDVQATCMPVRCLTKFFINNINNRISM